MLLSNVSKESVGCLMTDYVYAFTQSVAENLQLPRILLRSGSASTFAIYTEFHFLERKATSQNKLSYTRGLKTEIQLKSAAET